MHVQSKLIVLLMLIVSSFSLPAEETASGQITIEIRNSAFSARHIQVVDRLCSTELPLACLQYVEILKQCKQGKALEQGHCEINKQKYNAAECTIPGLIFDARLAADASTTISICANAQGYGEVSVRATDNTRRWTHKPWLKQGDRISHQ